MDKMPRKAAGRTQPPEPPATKGPTQGRNGRHAPKHAARQLRTTPTLMVGLAVVAAGGAGFLSLGRSGLNRPTPPVGPAPVTSPSVGGELISPEGPAPTPSTFEVAEARDPFRPLIVAEPDGAATASPASTAAATPAPSPESGAAGAPAPQGGEQVELIDVVVDDQGVTRAQVRVGSTVSTVAAGETFASTYQLLSVQGSCATLQNGPDRFTLCRGDQVLK
jgi:hypothetical protein